MTLIANKLTSKEKGYVSSPFGISKTQERIVLTFLYKNEFYRKPLMNLAS